MKIRAYITKFTWLNSLACTTLTFIGLTMLALGYFGVFDFGTGSMELIYHRLYMFIAISILSIAQYFVWSKRQKKFVAPFFMFVLLLMLFFVIGGGVGGLDALVSDARPTFNVVWFAFDVSTNAWAKDISIGLNAKLVADAIVVLVPAIMFMVVIFQMLYAGEADEFIKAFLEGISCVIFIWIYGISGGVPV